VNAAIAIAAFTGSGGATPAGGSGLLMRGVSGSW
jgi:hypothetical protein